MANQTINKVQINGNPETYDVEDTQARQGILDLTQKTNQLKEEFEALGLSVDEEGYIVQEVQE